MTTSDKNQKKIKAMFDRIAPTYDMLNHILSLSIDKQWRKRTAKEMKITGDNLILDLASGTGDMSFTALEICPECRVVGLDLSHNMLRLAQGKRHKKDVNSHCCFVSGDAYVLPFGVNTDVFKSMPRDQARTELDLPEDERLVLFPWHPARPEKRYDLVESAFEILKKQFENVRLVVVFNESHETIAKYMNACDVMVLASDHEGSPMAVREALACRLPVVSVDVGDVKQLIEGIPGCHLCTQDPQDIAAKLHAVLENPTRLEHNADNISAASIADKVIEIYHSALNEDRTRRKE